MLQQCDQLFDMNTGHIIQTEFPFLKIFDDLISHIISYHS
jgi:hypothetical protein